MAWVTSDYGFVSINVYYFLCESASRQNSCGQLLLRFRPGGRLAVLCGDSCSDAHGFESQHRMDRDGLFHVYLW